MLAEFTRTQRKLESVGVHEAHIVSQSSPPECPCPATSFCTVHLPHTVLAKGPVDVMLPAIMINSQPPNLPKTGESVSSTSVQQTSMLATIIVTKEPVDVSRIHCNKRGAKSRTNEVNDYEGSFPGTDQLLSPISPVVCPVRITCFVLLWFCLFLQLLELFLATLPKTAKRVSLVLYCFKVGNFN